MEFLEKVIESLIGEDALPKNFRLTVIGKSGFFIEPVKSVKSFSPEKIEVLLKKGEIEFIGKNLFIKKYIDKDLFVSGEIISFTVKND